MRFLKFLLIVLIAKGCTTNKSVHEKLKGHWHMVKGYPEDSRTTLDISDSTSILNKYSLLGSDKFELFDSSKQKILLPTFCENVIFPGVEGFHFKGDTLIYDKEYSCGVDYKFLKSDQKSCYQSHAVNTSTVLNLSKFPTGVKNQINWDSLQLNAIVGVIMVGEPISEELDSLPHIQVSDVFISVKDIPIYIMRSKAQYPDKSEFAVCLIIDERVRKSFADSVINSIPKSDSTKLFRLVKAKDSGELGYERIN